MGEVYRAYDPRLRREIALKVLPPSVASDADRLRRFEQEARAAGGLNHPNVLAVYDFGSHAGAPYLVAELLEGATLRDRLLGGPLPLRKALDFAAQIARGLAAAHDRGVVHRDLKPENLFVTREGLVKILDFGLAKALGVEACGSDSTLAATATGAVLGTAGYMAPEQVRGRPADGRADLFAFGAVLYEMLSGRRAFPGDTAIDRGHAILNRDPEPLATAGVSVPPAVERVLARCLEKAPDARFRSAADLGFALEALSSLSGPGTTPETATPPLRRATVCGALALLLVVFGVGGVLAGRWQAGRAARRAVALPAAPAPESPRSITRVSFRKGQVGPARFADEGRTVVYTAQFEGEWWQTFATRPGHPADRPVAPPGAVVTAVSPTGDLALDTPSATEPGSQVLARVPLAGGGPREIALDASALDFGPGDTMLVVRRRPQMRWQIEYPLGTVRLQLEGQQGMARLAPAADAIAFTHHPMPQDDAGTVELLGLDGTRRRLAGPFESVSGLAWAPGGRELWFTAGSSLYAVTRDGRQRLVWRVPGGLRVADIAADGRVLFAQQSIRFRAVGVVPGSSREAGLSWLDGTLPAALSPDGRTLLFGEMKSGGVGGYQTYVRRTDGGPAVNLGAGVPSDLSPDGRWAIVNRLQTGSGLALVPTGPGDVRQLPPGEVAMHMSAWFLPDGKRIVFNGRAKGRPMRLWLQDLAGGAPRPFSAEGVTGRAAPSPDGAVIPARIEGRPVLLPLDGGQPRPLALAEDERVLQLTADGKAIFVYVDQGEPPTMELTVRLRDLATGSTRPWRTFTPPDPAGVHRSWLRRVLVTPDGRYYVHSYQEVDAALYVAEGLR